MICRLVPLLVILGLATGCTMFKAWKSIPPPGGCNQCHTLPIKGDWEITYQAAILTDERDRLYFQTEQYNMPKGATPPSSLELRKEQDLACFECHKSPNKHHKERKGRYHH